MELIEEKLKTVTSYHGVIVNVRLDEARLALKGAREAGIPDARIDTQAVFRRTGLVAPPSGPAPAPPAPPAPPMTRPAHTPSAAAEPEMASPMSASGLSSDMLSALGSAWEAQQ